MSTQLAWRLTTNIDDTRTLFIDQHLPFCVDSYSCSCSHKKFIIRSNEQEIEKYICEICENDTFLDANLFLGNAIWYERIENSFSQFDLKNLTISTHYDSKVNSLVATVYFEIPKSIDLSSDTIQCTKKEIFQIYIHHSGRIKEILNADFQLEQFNDSERSYYDDFDPQEELINRHPILIHYKKRILQEIINNRYFNLNTNIYKQAQTLEHIGFFVKHIDRKEFSFYYWMHLDSLPTYEIATIDEALNYVSNNTKSKTLRKTIFENYKEQLREDKSYYFIYPYCIAKYIKDVNIANRLINLNFKNYFEYLNDHDALEYFLEYLTKYFSDKQIENLFISYKKQEIFWFIHALELFAELGEELREDFLKVACKYNILHDEIVKYHRLMIHQRFLEIKFNYTSQQTKSCTTIEPYDIRLPVDGYQLYNWSTALGNCLAGYTRLISEYKTTVYGFFQDDIIKFAVEIQNSKIIQARSKYNQNLSSDDMAIVLEWHKEFILKNELDEFRVGGKL